MKKMRSRPDLAKFERPEDYISREESHGSRILLEIIEQEYFQTDDPELKRLYLEIGLELCGMDARELFSFARQNGLGAIAEVYRNYANPNNSSILS